MSQDETTTGGRPATRLDRVEAWASAVPELADSPHITASDVLALVEVAKAARELVAVEAADHHEGWFSEYAGRLDALAADLARLEED